MNEDDKNLAQELRDLAALSENGPYVSLKTQREAFMNAAARIESLAADLQRVTKERDSLQQQLRQIRGTDQWRD